jgi:hypothetical protein
MDLIRMLLALSVLLSPLSATWYSADYNGPAWEPGLDKFLDLDSSPTGLQTGYTDGTVGTNKVAWPIHQGGPYRVLKYCYVDEATREKLTLPFCAGMQLWKEALGGEAGSATGHSLKIQEAHVKVQRENDKSERKPLFCFKQGTWDNVKRDGVWNPDVTIDHLAISYKPGGTTFSTVGYQPHASDPLPYKHQMELSEDSANPTVFQPHIVAHEVSSSVSPSP